MYQYKAEIIRVIDGDTVDVRIDLGFDVHIMQRVRLEGVDTPETRTLDLREKKFGFIAKQFVESKLIVGEVYTLNTKLDEKGKFGRALGVFELPDGSSLNQLLISSCLGIPYLGQSRESIRVEHEKNWAILDEKSIGDSILSMLP